jgi:hypothetical protein
MEVRATAFAEDVGVVCRRADADSSGGASKGIAQVVRQVLKLVSPEPVLVLKHNVVRRSRCALQSLVREKEEVE